MMAAIVGVVLIINRQMAGLLQDLLLFVFPLPMVFYAAKYGMKQSKVLYAAVVFLSFILSTPQTMFYVASEMLIGLFYGSGIHEKKPTGRIIRYSRTFCDRDNDHHDCGSGILRV